ncbi:hypothetical protein LPJ60_001233 [Coemansia sp. RSA 2675]|nr:hypothetical protein LPJ60_001233 [Coemansia sp. RSA 2675]
MNYNNNYGDQYNNNQGGYGQTYDQGGNYGQGYNQSANYDQQYDVPYGGPQPTDQYNNQPFNAQQYDNQFANPPYNAQQYHGGQQPGNSDFGGNQAQKPQSFAFDIDFANVNDDMPAEQVARMLLGENAYANDLKGLQISENSTRDLNDFSMGDLQRSGEDTERGLFSGGGNGQSKKSHQILGGAAAWAALNWYQTKSRNQGKKVSHGFAKKLMVAFAAAQAIKYWEKNSKSFQNGVSRDLVIAEATRSASIAADISASADAAPIYKYDTSLRGGEADNFDNAHGQPQQFNQQQPQYGGYDNNQQQQYGGGYNNSQQQQYGGGYGGPYGSSYGNLN